VTYFRLCERYLDRTGLLGRDAPRKNNE